MARYEVDGLEEMIREVGRIGDGPSPQTRERLDAVLAAQFADTQERVGVDTGDLLASGRVESDYDPVSRTWEGTITYGAANNPAVEYALYHRHDDDGSDFFAGLVGYEPLYEEIIDDSL